jgi:hypothetical protein
MKITPEQAGLSAFREKSNSAHHKENVAFVLTGQPVYAPAIDALAHCGRPAQPQKPRFNLHEDRG